MNKERLAKLALELSKNPDDLNDFLAKISLAICLENEAKRIKINFLTNTLKDGTSFIGNLNIMMINKKKT